MAKPQDVCVTAPLSRPDRHVGDRFLSCDISTVRRSEYARILKDAVLADFNVLSRYFPGEADENKETRFS